MMNLNKHVVTNTNDESLSMPSRTASMHDEILHFYVDPRSIEDNNTKDEDATREDNAS